VTGPLSGVKVLDLTRILAGPWATQMLADFGADVIKIEKPGEGDDTRGWGPPFVTDPDGSHGDAAYFQSANAGKKSVCIDMAQPDGQQLLRQLAAQSDVLIENFKVDGLKRYGLDYSSLKAINPRLIYCSITGFGQTGPLAHRAGYDFIIQGMAGVMSITGTPDGEPMKMGVAFSDIFAGLHAVIGITSALFHREKNGQGQHIDISLLDSQVAVLANQAANYLVGGRVPKRMGNAHPNIVPYQTFETRDGHIIMAVGNDRQYAEFCTLIGAPHLCHAPYKTNSDRVENRDRLIPLLRPYMKQKNTAEWTEIFETAAVPCGPINTIDQVFDSPQIKARNMQVQLQRHDGVQIPGVANPVVFSDSVTARTTPSPLLGNDTSEVLSTRLGLGQDVIADLKSRGVIA
jgi:crotonobetainyl-CoA:carnitine CoA-transferase CaiB-like acyl-CoA transferase